MLNKELIEFNGDKFLTSTLHYRYRFWMNLFCPMEFDRLFAIFGTYSPEIIPFLNIPRFYYSETLDILERGKNPFPKFSNDSEDEYEFSYFDKVQNELFYVNWAKFFKDIVVNNCRTDYNPLDLCITSLHDMIEKIPEIPIILNDSIDPKIKAITDKYPQKCFRLINQIMITYWRGSVYDLLLSPLWNGITLDMCELDTYYEYSNDIKALDYFPADNLFAYLKYASMCFIRCIKIIVKIIAAMNKMNKRMAINHFSNYGIIRNSDKFFIREIINGWCNNGILSTIDKFSYKENIVEVINKSIRQNIVDTGSKLILDYPLVI
jgi:hypothetical protein